MIAIPKVRPNVNFIELGATDDTDAQCLSLRASALVWLMLSAASWGVVFSGARILIG